MPYYGHPQELSKLTLTRSRTDYPPVPQPALVGINHSTAPVALREQLALSGDRLAEALAALRTRVPECAIISTCNRLEIYCLLPPGEDPSTLVPLVYGEGEHLLPHTYAYSGREAARHLFRVASGLDSLVLGEVQILGQVQRAWQEAHKAGAAGPVISGLFHRAVALGKRVHSETTLSRQPASVSYAAVALARQIFGPSLSERRVLVVGTGEVGEGVARCLSEHGVQPTVVVHRRLEQASEVARRYHADVAPWDELPERLGSADIVISSTAAPHIVLTRTMIEDAIEARVGKPLYLIDLALPRDIDPLAAEVPGVHLSNIDDLHEVVKATMREREGALPQIRVMIDLETARFSEWLQVREAAPAIEALRREAESVTRSELRWAARKLPNLTPQELRVIETMAARMAGKLLHRPTLWLKAQAAGEGEPLYGLESLSTREMTALFYSGGENARTDTGKGENDAAQP
jgi:glutamyl-tRNA reductase